MAFGFELSNDIFFTDENKKLPLPTKVSKGDPGRRAERYAIQVRNYRNNDRDTLPRPICPLNMPSSKYPRRWNNLPQPTGPYDIEQLYTGGRFTEDTLPVIDGLGNLEGWFKRVKQAVKKGISQPLKIVAAVNPVTAPLMLMKKETRGRVLRRVGGALTGAAAGFATGGPIGAGVGAATGGLMAKKGTKGIKGYGKIGLVSAATGGVASFATGAIAGKTGLMAADTVSKFAGGAGKYGFQLMTPAQAVLQGGASYAGQLATGSQLTNPSVTALATDAVTGQTIATSIQVPANVAASPSLWSQVLSAGGKALSAGTALAPMMQPATPAQPSGPSTEVNNFYQAPTGETYPIDKAGYVQTPGGMFPITDLMPPQPSQPSLTIPGWRPQSAVPTGFSEYNNEGVYEKSLVPFAAMMEETSPITEKPPFGLSKSQLLLLMGGVGILAVMVASGKTKH